MIFVVELLAPAGNFDALRAAVESGADAVYLAGEKFGARAFADNFSRETLIEAVKFAHLRGTAVHVTVNTIISDAELENLAEYLKFLRLANVDALLIQDLGVFSVAKAVVPEIPLHASTQMSIHNLEGVKMLAKLGFSRVVLSRELTLDEISAICHASPIETEIFVHGALCICWSGQCLMSSLIGGRSGNRGKCAQPCRLPYELVDERGKIVLNDAGKFILSPKDLNTLEILPKLVETGVNSLKIEGRMKRAEYVATVVKVYRDFLDKKSLILGDGQQKLAQIFNRDFTTAYLERNPGKNLISDMRPNNRGVLIGRVIEVFRDKIVMKLAKSLHAGDQIEIWVKIGGRMTFTAENFTFYGDKCTLQVQNTRGIRVHDRVFKIFDAELTSEARKYFTGTPVRKIFVDASVFARVGEPLTLNFTDSDGNSATASTKFLCEAAKNRPLTLEMLENQFGRLGNSIFALRNGISADIDANLMVPISEMNDLRRKVVAELENQRLKRFSRKILPSNALKTFSPCKIDETKLVAQVDTLEKAKIALESGADEILFGGETFTHKKITSKQISEAISLIHGRGKQISLGTPRLVRENEFFALEKLLTNEVDAIYVHNLGTMSLAKKFSPEIRTDFSLIVFNAATINVLREIGVRGVTLSPELSLSQVKMLAKASSLPVECIIHGRQELMISSYCVLGSFLGNLGEKTCPNVCQTGNFYLRDRLNANFPVVTDQFCRMHILNAKILSMIDHRGEFEGISRLRIDCRALNDAETAKIVRSYKFGGSEIENFTRGHYFRGVTDV